jgi:hypothetical protein
VLGRKTHSVPRLEGYGRMPVLLEEQCSFQDIDQLRPRLKVSTPEHRRG